MKKRTQVLSILVLFFTMVSSNVPAQELIARVSDWPPFYVEKNGAWTGLTVDAYRALLEEAGVVYSFQATPWNRAMKKMKTQPIIMGHLTPLEERKKTMHFIGPHFNEVIGIAIDKRYIDVKVKNLDQVAALCATSGRQVGYQHGVFYSNEFNARIKNDPEFKSKFFRGAGHGETAIKMIVGGHLLGLMDEKVALDYIIKTEGVLDQIAVYDFEISKTPVYFGVSKTISPEVLLKLREANKVLLVNGTYDTLLKKWLAQQYDEEE